MYLYTIKQKQSIMTINLNTNTQTIKELLEMGLTNNYKSQPLHRQRKCLLQEASLKGLIKLKK